MDLHEMQIFDERTGGTSTMYLIAFLDDASRFIMQYRLITDKRSETCAAVLADAFQVWAPQNCPKAHFHDKGQFCQSI
jgi:hypothetical protein